MQTVKTAISIQKPLFEEAEGMARKLKISRSRLIALALEDFMRRQENRELFERINAAYAEEPDPEEMKLLRKHRKSQKRALKDSW